MNDEIIDHILLKISETVAYRLQYDDNDGFDDSEYAKNFIFMLNELNLIKVESKNSDIVTLTNFGYEVIKKNGWIKYSEIETLKLNNAESKGFLEVENLKLQKESAEHSITLRQKDDEIKSLTIENLILQNRQLKRYVLYSSVSFILGAVLTNLKDILDLWKIMTL